MLDFITWNVNPTLTPESWPITVRYYGLFFALAFIVAYKIMEYVYKRETILVEEVDRLSIFMILSVIIGARLGHVLFYEPADYFKDPITILYIWKGGLASHGAAIALLIGIYLYIRTLNKKISNSLITVPKSKYSYLWMLDRLILTIPIGGAFIRLGNLMNSEIYGHETTFPWGFRFVRGVAEEYGLDPKDVVAEMVPPSHPTQIYEAVAYIIIFVILFMMYRKKGPAIREGRLFGWFLILLFGVRFVVEFVKNIQVGFETNLIAKTHLNMGQWLSIPFIIAGIIIMLKSYQNKKEDENPTEEILTTQVVD